MTTAVPDATPPEKPLDSGEIDLSLISVDWPLTPLQGKKAYVPGWTKNPFTLSQIQKELEEGHAAEIKRAEEQRDTALGDLETVKGERESAQSNFAALQTKYDTELQELKRAQAAVRTNSPTAVRGAGSAMGIRFAQSPTLQGKGGFRGTLAGLTRQSGPASKLKVQTLNV